MKVPNLCCIYAIISPSGRVYIGQTRNVNQRWRHHRNDRHSNGPLQRSLAKYGFRAHAFAVLAVFDSEEDQAQLNTAEREWLKSCANSGLPLLNLTEGGDNARPSKEHKDKIRCALIGIKRSDETKRRISEGKKGEVHTEEHKRMVSERLRGRPSPLKGRRFPNRGNHRYKKVPQPCLQFI